MLFVLGKENCNYQYFIFFYNLFIKGSTNWNYLKGFIVVITLVFDCKQTHDHFIFSYVKHLLCRNLMYFIAYNFKVLYLKLSLT
jgi:hypothetical protein